MERHLVRSSLAGRTSCAPWSPRSLVLTAIFSLCAALWGGQMFFSSRADRFNAVALSSVLSFAVKETKILLLYYHSVYYFCLNFVLLSASDVRRAVFGVKPEHELELLVKNLNCFQVSPRPFCPAPIAYGCATKPAAGICIQFQPCVGTLNWPSPIFQLWQLAACSRNLLPCATFAERKPIQSEHKRSLRTSN